MTFAYSCGIIIKSVQVIRTRVKRRAYVISTKERRKKGEKHAREMHKKIGVASLFLSHRDP